MSGRMVGVSADVTVRELLNGRLRRQWAIWSRVRFRDVPRWHDLRGPRLGKYLSDIRRRLALGVCAGPTQCVGDATCDCVPSVVATYVCAKNIDGVGCGMDDAGLTIVCVAH